MKNKHVVVVGGSSGIGLAVAQAAEREGARVTVGSRRNGFDVRDEKWVEAFFEKTGPVDHLVFTAGDALVVGRVADLELGTIRGAFDVRIFGALTVLKHAKVRESIVLTSGVAFNRPQSGWAIGAGICGAMEGIGRALAVELAPVRVNIVSPGVVKTPLWGESPTFTGPAGEPDVVAETYLHLMRSTFTTGQVAIVDGGAVLR